MEIVQSLLRLVHSKDNGKVISPLQGRRFPSPAAGLSFVSFFADLRRPINVADSAGVAIKLPPSSPAPAALKKVDPGGIGFLDDMGGSVNGLMSCTESLGFESSDERRSVDEQTENIDDGELGSRTAAAAESRTKRKRSEVIKSDVKKFPPPLSSLNQDGKPTFSLRPVRKDGRLELREVKNERLEGFHASRQDGRLRLNLIRDVDVEEQSEEEEEEEKVEDNNRGVQEEEEEEEEIEIGDANEKEEKTGEKWEYFPVVNGGGSGFRRCHELMSRLHHRRHQNLQTWWRVPCVASRCGKTGSREREVGRGRGGSACTCVVV
ncbi:hypothetical protein U1Q18_004189 [Sarracenia purpurea var. burkii]